MAGQTEDPQQEQVEIQKQDLALRAKKQLDIMKMHKDKMDLEESKLIVDDENKDEDRKLKEAELAVKATNDVMKDFNAQITKFAANEKQNIYIYKFKDNIGGLNEVITCSKLFVFSYSSINFASLLDLFINVLIIKIQSSLL